MPTTPTTEARQTPRLKVPAMYTLLRARRAGERRYGWTGHVYDLSLAGMRFELDVALEPGTALEIRVLLPSGRHQSFNAAGRVVRIHDAEGGPARMALRFDRFASDADRHQLEDFLQEASDRVPTLAQAA